MMTYLLILLPIGMEETDYHDRWASCCGFFPCNDFCAAATNYMKAAFNRNEGR